MITAEFKGGKMIADQFRLLEKKVQKKELGKSLRAGVNVIVKDAKARVPVREGRTKRAIRGRVLKEKIKGFRMAVIGVLVGKSRDDTKGSFYAYWIEKGTRFMAAQPFLRPAMDAKHPEALNKVADNMKKVIQS